jgi:hypothetical protein
MIQKSISSSFSISANPIGKAMRLNRSATSFNWEKEVSDLRQSRRLGKV